MISVCGLWLNKKETSKLYLSGTINGTQIRVLIFKNENKKSAMSPDYNLVIDKVQPRTSSLGEEVSPDEVPDIDNNPFDDKALPF